MTIYETITVHKTNLCIQLIQEQTKSIIYTKRRNLANQHTSQQWPLISFSHVVALFESKFLLIWRHIWKLTTQDKAMNKRCRTNALLHDDLISLLRFFPWEQWNLEDAALFYMTFTKLEINLWAITEWPVSKQRTAMHLWHWVCKLGWFQTAETSILKVNMSN